MIIMIIFAEHRADAGPRTSPRTGPRIRDSRGPRRSRYGDVYFLSYATF